MFEIDWGTILLQTVNFLIVAAILYFLALKPIVKKAETQAAKKARLMEQLEHDQKEASQKLKEVDVRLSHFDQELQQIADDAYDQNRQLQQELLTATRDEADQILQDAVVEARKEHLIDMKRQQGRMIDVVMTVSAETIQKVLPDGTQNKLVTDLVDHIWSLGKTDKHQVNVIRESLSGRTPVVQVSTAKPLSIEQKGNLIRLFSALADNDVELELETDESLIAGIKVLIGDQIIENSIKSQLSAVREDVDQALEQIYMDDDGSD